MQHAEQITVAKRLLSYIDEGTTAMSDDLYRQSIDEYICPEIAARERQHFFTAEPLCLGASGLLPGPGSFATDDLSGRPILLTRGKDGQVRAFLNVCRHRGARVADGCGKSGKFVCPYHAWTYSTEGQLVARPEDAAFEGMDKQSHGLRALPVVEKDGLIWVCPTPGKPFDIDARLDGMAPDIAGFDLSGFHHYESRILKRRMNWKLVVDTFLESYHFCILHKDSICPIFHQNLGAFDSWGRNFRLVSPRRTIEELRDQPEASWDLLRHSVGIYILFPNTVLVWQGDHVELWHIYPDGDDPDASIMKLSFYVPEEATSEKARGHWDRNMELLLMTVEEEDFPVGEQIQKSFRSGAQDHITFGRNEPGLTHYHHSITDALAEAG